MNKPTLNENLMNQRVRRRYIFPHGTFTRRNNRNTLESRVWGNSPFFTNAKSSSMLERGWVRSTDKLETDQRGLLTQKDGPEVEVRLVMVKPLVRGNKYKFITGDNTIIVKEDTDRFEEWDFYYRTTPKPFVARGGAKKTRVRRKIN
jgi:hypothetical protein